ncbi:MAG: hypothetical protein QM770_15425 [Tepidisphaeraceae bacterium]
MLFSIKAAVAALTVASSLFIGGCQSSAKTASAADAGPAVACSKCKTTYTKQSLTLANPRSSQMTTIDRTVADHECPSCKNFAKTYLSGNKIATAGTVVHTCADCGGDMTVCH